MKIEKTKNDEVQFLYVNTEDDRVGLNDFLLSNNLEKIDTINSQLQELLRIRNPNKTFSQKELKSLVLECYGDQHADFYGVWVYYPWLKKCIHLLDENEFVEVRTSRNKLKITKDEQDILRGKRIGVIGLSVGQASAITMAMESLCGEIRIADFDTLELSNMNRIRTSVKDLGQSKVSITKRAIAEIDPYVIVKTFAKGIDASNIEEFLNFGGKIDILVEECDSLEVKILSRLYARKHRIPVVMETSDRGMLDIERFDKEPSREIFHGQLSVSVENLDLDQLEPQQKKSLLLEIIDIENISQRGLESLQSMGKSISSWPQLMSDVTLGAAILCTTVRKILLGHQINSGRHYVDISEIIAPKNLNQIKV